MKTPIDIINGFVKVLDVPLVRSAMKTGGKVFPSKRPVNHKTECIVVNALPATGEQFQRCVANINIHVPNLKLNIGGESDNSHPDVERLKAISDVVLPILTEGLFENTVVTTIENTSIIEEQELYEHYLNIRVATRTVNF